MSRWHEPSCRDPDVAVDATARISCQACGATLNLQELVSKQAVQSPFPFIPPDEPPGKLNLGWPPCVPYQRGLAEAKAEAEAAEPCQERGHEHGHAYVGVSSSASTPNRMSISPNPAQKPFPAPDEAGRPRRTPSRRRARPEARNPKRRRPSGVDDNTGHSLVPLKRAPSPALTEEDIVVVDGAVAGSSFLPLYGDVLGQNEFRLACLDAADHTGPENAWAAQHIHLSLETYTHDSCPEYETVSYTWAGEDGDSAWTCPIYVGPYWDVVLVTKNCEAMIRFLRPKRGLRLLWIDVVCINQSNVDEREGQVAKMGRIYEESSGVVVYLGEDLVLNMPDRYPPRHRLHKLDTMQIPLPVLGSSEMELTRITLQQLLGRRYFSRVWVIQELILAPRASIPVGDVVFLADSLLSKYLKMERSASGWSWDETSAPWVQYIAQGAFPVNKVSDLMGLTLSSLASDPRDKVFGVLGLYQDGSEKYKLRPDYSVSCQHVFMGFFAYCVITLRELHLLFNAAGVAKTGPYPSWMPDWKSPDSWQQAFRRLQESEIHSDRVTASIQSSPPPPHMVDDSIQPGIDDILHGVPRFFRLGTENEKSDSGLKRIFPVEMSLDISVDMDDPPVFDLRPWYKDARVDRDTGALSLHLTRLMTIKRTPIFVKKTGVLRIYELLPEQDDDPTYQDVSMYLGSPLPLINLIQPGLDDIFILNPGDEPLIYLILRRVEDASSAGRTFHLVAPCPYLSIRGTARDIPLSLSQPSNPLTTTNTMPPPPPLLLSPPQAQARFQSLERLQSNRYAEIKGLRRLLDHRIDEYFGSNTTTTTTATNTNTTNNSTTANPVSMPYSAERIASFKRRTAQAFPGRAGARKWVLLPVCLSCVRLDKGSESDTSSFERAYKRALDASFCAEVVDGFVRLRFNAWDWQVAQGEYYGGRGGMMWEWCDAGTATTTTTTTTTSDSSNRKWKPVSRPSQDGGAALEWAMSLDVSQTQQSMDVSFASQNQNENENEVDDTDADSHDGYGGGEDENEEEEDAYVWVRCPLAAVRELVRDHAWDLGLYGTSYASLQLEREDAEARIRSGPDEEDRFIASERDTGVFELDGSTFQVHIL